MKVIIVGGVAGGASCAERLRRLDEKAEILLLASESCRLCHGDQAHRLAQKSGMLAREG